MTFAEPTPGTSPDRLRPRIGGHRAARVLLAGGGHAHAVFLRTLIEERRRPFADLTLVTPESRGIYSGMLPAIVAGGRSRDDATIPIRGLCAASGVRYVRGRIRSLDLTDRQALLEDGGSVSFDVLSLDVGSRPPEEAIPGATDHAVPVRPPRGFLDAWEARLARLDGGGPVDVVVVGGGAAGVEVACAIAGERRRRAGSATVTLVSASSRLVPGHRPRASRKLLAALGRAGVSVHLSTRVTLIAPAHVTTDSGLTLRSDFTVLATGSRPPSWLGESGLRTDDDGRVLTDRSNQCVSHGGVFVVGDAGVVDGHPRPPAGVYAVRAGRLLARVLPRYLEGRPLPQPTPSRHYLALIGTNDGRAVASFGPLVCEGRPWMALKRRIDDGYMRRLQAAANAQAP